MLLPNFKSLWQMESLSFVKAGLLDALYFENFQIFQLASPHVLKSNMSISPGDLVNQAPNILPQFRVNSVAFVKQFDQSDLSVEIKMRRIIWYHVTNTFIPTIR